MANSFSFDIIDYIVGLTDFSISRSMATNIARKRNVIDVVDYSELEERDKDLLLADVIYSIQLKPRKSASYSQSHGDYSVSMGSEEVGDISNLLAMADRLYAKWKEKNDIVVEYGNLQWL